MDPKALPAATLRSWEREQAGLRAAVVPEDTERWQREPGWAGLRRVGGVDLSYGRGNDGSACVSLVVLSYPGLEVLYEDCRMVAVSAPYVAGFLAFREVPFMVEAVQRLQREQPELRPQVLLVDGNGLLHQRGFGVACHLGVLTDLPCVGVAKNLLHVDGLAKDELHKEQIRSLQKKGDTFPLMGTSGAVLGMLRHPEKELVVQVLFTYGAVTPEVLCSSTVSMNHSVKGEVPTLQHLTRMNVGALDSEESCRGNKRVPCEAATAALNPCISQWAIGYAWRQLCILSSPAANTGSQSPSARCIITITQPAHQARRQDEPSSCLGKRMCSSQVVCFSICCCMVQLLEQRKEKDGLTLDRGRIFRSRCVPHQQLYLPG
ncbi:endonuclease V isoform X2 [Meleagris gallopavo]|uniref:Endonuclease V n=1 Tax=Meleagris gallopavo TaxID=9103 RepID=A0A803YG58_MELGA|nr:endonuclease V isoform X2 [Meleagris gallopavo]